MANNSNQVTQSTVAVLQAMIRSGELKTGETIPPQRELAEKLNVSRSSLREALSVLEAVGMLRTKPRKGTYVSSPDLEEGSHKPWPLQQLYTPAEAYQFRFVIEGHAARLTAMNATEEHIASLRANFDKFKEAVRVSELVTYSQFDFEFHRMLMLFSGNRLYLDMYDQHAAIFRESQRLPLTWHRRLWEPVSEHENILRAIERRDPDEARYFMHVHVMRAAQRVGETLNEVC
ncbi:FadR/GntR family transcriptional regulator [Agrobacterium vitis]|uniref:FadR/GntR family transcriptional regulator n=1 Tax=Agrobacterium vitis TaxID=373 RepID=UPI0018D1FA3F|nr:FadR/GntR family transcriptional regulator [Agrobacterium vitis]